MSSRVVVVGAGIGGLACAARLAHAGCAVTVLDAADAPGGKLREMVVGGRPIGVGPTVLTMRWVFESLFAECDASLDAALRLTPLATLARHAWPDGSRLDLFADQARSAAAIGALCGAAEQRGFLAFCDRARRVYETLRDSFISAPQPTPFALMRRTGIGGILRISPFTTYWQALREHFADPRLRQLFARYATYCGADPFAAPATLMLVAHVEQQGVWSVEGGMAQLARAVAALARRHGATLRQGAEVTGLVVKSGRAAGVTLARGEVMEADAVVVNADQAALVGGLFGAEAAGAMPRAATARSLSAVTWAMVGTARGFPLLRHNVFFSPDYEAEFAALRQGPPPRPTVYLCAADRLDAPVAPAGGERLFAIVNAPAAGDTAPLGTAGIERATSALQRAFQSCGMELTCEASQVTTPTDFARMFPATGGALYGPATHGAYASFRRPGSRTALPGLYLAGGSVHPGAGVPMAALSGRMAAICLLQDGVSTSLARRAAIAGGMPTG